MVFMRWRSGRMLACAACAALVITVSLRAQFEVEELRDSITREGLPSGGMQERAYLTLLMFAGCTAEQRAAAKDLFESYHVLLSEARDKLAVFLEEISGSPYGPDWHDKAMSAMAFPVREAYREYENKLLAELKSDTAALLNADQQHALTMWRTDWSGSSSFWGLPWGFLRGDDLVVLTSAVLAYGEVDADVRHLLMEYSRRREEFETAASKSAPPLHYSEIDSDEKLSEGERIAKLREHLAGEMHRAEDGWRLDEETMRRLHALLPADVADRIERRYLQSTGLIWENNYHSLWRQLAGIAALTTEQHKALSAIRAEFNERQVSRAREEWITMRRSSATELVGSDGYFRSAWAGLWDKQREDFRGLLQRIRAVLTPEQIQEAGHPILTERLDVPDFDDPDAPDPRPKFDPGMPHREDFLLTASVDTAEILDLHISFLVQATGADTANASAMRELHAEYSRAFRKAARLRAAFQRDLERAVNQFTIEKKESAELRRSSEADYGRYCEGLRKTLLEDLRGLIGPDDEEAWVRFNTRATAWRLDPSRRNWGGTGILNILDAVQAAANYQALPPDVGRFLVAYEKDAAPILKRLDEATALHDSLQYSFVPQLQESEPPELIRLLMDREKHLSALRDLGIDAAEKISEALPAEQRLIFEDAAFRGYALKYRTFWNPRDVFLSPQVLLVELKGKSALDEQHAASLRRISVGQLPRLIEQRRAMCAAIRHADELPYPERQRNQWRISGTPIDGYISAWTNVTLRMLEVLPEDVRSRLPVPYRPPKRPEDVAVPRFGED